MASYELRMPCRAACRVAKVFLSPLWKHSIRLRWPRRPQLRKRAASDDDTWPRCRRMRDCARFGRWTCWEGTRWASSERVVSCCDSADSGTWTWAQRDESRGKRLGRDSAGGGGAERGGGGRGGPGGGWWGAG